MRKNIFGYLLALCLAMASTAALGWGGSGTPDAPYLIRNSSDWQAFADSVSTGSDAARSASYRLTGDITAKTPVGTSDRRFKGVFDGGGHTVTAALTSASGCTAPFAYIEGATISHLHVAGAIRGGRHTAGIASSVVGTGNAITDCRVSAAITTFAEDNMVVAGGIVGHANESTLAVEGCLFDGAITATSSIGYSYAGAIVGWCASTASITVKNCVENATYTSISHAGMNYTYGTPPSASAIPSVNSYTLNHNWGEVKHGYKVESITDGYTPDFGAIKTGYATSGISVHDLGLGLTEKGLSFNGTYYAGLDEAVHLAPFPAGYTAVYANNVRVAQTAPGYLQFYMPGADVFLSLGRNWAGEGTEASPYLIEDAGGWQQFANEVGEGRPTAGEHFLLTRDIDIYVRAGSDANPSFCGVFDGGGHTITAHLTGGDYTSPFYKLDGGTIRNLHVAGEISGGLHTSGLVGGIPTNADNANLIENCRVSATITCSSTHAGGFVGHASGSTTTLRGCLFDGAVSGGNLAFVGTLVGWCTRNGGGITLADCADLASHNARVRGGQGCKVDLVLDGTNYGSGSVVGRCGSDTNTYGGYEVGNSWMVLRNGSPAVELTYFESADPVEYSVSHLTSYGHGLMFDDLYVCERTAKVHFQATATEGFALVSLSTNEGATITLTDSGWYEFALVQSPSLEFTINATVSSSGDFAGEGTEASPYLIGSTADWTKLWLEVKEGNSYAGKVLRMTHDIDCGGVSVGTDEHPFCGTFDGDGHTLTLHAGSEYNPSDVAASPFYRVGEATFRHLHTAGKVCTGAQYTGGIVSQVFGTKATRFYDCHSSTTIVSTLSGDASNGGLVGAASNCDSLVFERCSFTGNLHTWVPVGVGATNCGGFVGWSNVPVTIRESLFDPSDLVFNLQVTVGQNFARMADYGKLTIQDSYITYNFAPSTAAEAQLGNQGVVVVGEFSVPDGAGYEFVGEPDVTFNGRDYYKSGCWIRTMLDASVPFDHWQDGTAGCFISDPWTRDGLHQLKDLRHKPSLGVSPIAIPEAETERTLWGVKYRYLSRRDYHFFISDEERLAKGWEFESGDSDANLIVRNSDNDASEITAVVGCDESAGDFLVESDGIKGVQIHNDLVGVFRTHTHLGVIAPHAFKGCTKLEKLYFIDTDANNYNALLPFDFLIDQNAFENCAKFKELMLMQYTTKGDNHWEGLIPGQVFRVADDAFTGCPNLRISVRADHYQNYLSSTVWKKHWNRFIAYESTGADFTVKGVKYHWYRDVETEDNNGVKNDETGKADMMKRLVLWNGLYQQFSAASLLDTKDDCNVYYASVVGVDDDDIDDEDGVMRIYNDPGSYYNYKTIVLNRDAIAGNTHVKAIEFWQTNGRSENSYSDLKMVIPNGAFKGCTNLKELRLFYYVQDGNDRWEALGPKNVIPGDNIFGLPSAEEVVNMTDEQIENMKKVHKDFRIIVATELYQDFLDDPNWQPYLGFMEPEDYSPSEQTDFTEDGLTYGFMLSPGGIMQTSQVVSQDVSWWTAPRIGIEVLLWIASIKSIVNAVQAATSAKATLESAQSALQTACNDVLLVENSITEYNSTLSKLSLAIASGGKEQIKQVFTDETFSSCMDLGILPLMKANTLQPAGFNLLVEMELSTQQGAWVTSLEKLTEIFEKLSADKLVRACYCIRPYFSQMIKDFTKKLVENKALMAAAQRNLDLALSRIAAVQATKIAAIRSGLSNAGSFTISTNTAAVLSTKCWGGSGSYNADLMNKGMRENILSNIYQVGLVGGGYVITTPQKNLVYHTFVRNVADDVQDAVIKAGSWTGTNQSTATITFHPKAFRNKTNLRTVRFEENPCTSNASTTLPFTIPDSAFVGCTNLTEFSTLLRTDGNGTRALGPENFILGGDSIFAGLDSLKFHIVIDPLRKQDFLDNASWAPLERFFIYEDAKPEDKYSEYGANYAYAYEQNSIKKEHKERGHLIEHTIVTGPDDKFITGHQGAVKLCNDIGTYNNYQLDAVMPKAFKGNQNLRSVSFTDLYGFGAIGDCYTGLQVHLGDSAFVDCTNLADLDLLYLVTDGTNKITPITPQMVTIGKGVFDGTSARLKMMPQQVAWFEADSAWAAYKDRFMPCVIRFTDPGVKKALKEMAYYDPANTYTDQSLWDDYCDFARIGGAGFSWLDGKFTAQKDKIYSFADFKWFESVGLDYVGASWFEGCSKLGNIVLPSTIKTIGARAFNGCSSLREMELPRGVISIGASAFDGCTSLDNIVVRDSVPATLGVNAFHKHDGLRIWVPTEKVCDYETAWSEYERYINPMANYNIYKEVHVYAPGDLASKLGLTLIKENDKVRYIQGPYARYDSLTVIGPLNGEDVAVLRHMMGANAWESEFTDGQLRYLNLWDADLKKDTENSYNGYGVDEYLEKDNWVGEYMFHNCNALESVVLPRTVTEIGENAFQEAFGLKRIAVGKNTTTYTRDLLQALTGIEELVFLTTTPATSESSDPWEAPIQQVYTLPTQLGDYLGDPGLIRQAQGITSPFSKDEVMWTLADKSHFFPSEYLELENADNIFTNNTQIKNLDEFYLFQNVKTLGNTFAGMRAMETVTLPSSVEDIGYLAFYGCTSLKTIHVSSVKTETVKVPENAENPENTKDSVAYIVPTLADDAFKTLPSDFQILVPKQFCKLYREHWSQYADHINPDNSNHAYEEIVTVTLTEPNTLAEKLGLTATTRTSSGETWVNGLKGDYSRIYKLKVIGPISGGDLDVMRHLSGYCPWASSRNYAGRLEYIDLYDANLVESSIGVAGYYKASTSFYLTEHFQLYHVGENELPHHAFLRAYNLRTLILPRTCKKVNERALQECEGLETLVIGDDMETFNWNALDDDAMLMRMYLLAKKKVKITTEFAVWRWLCNNYNPTFDAFYVLPSLYNEYLTDDAYTGDSWQRTNNISKGMFDDDASFRYFASHAAATPDDLFQVYSVKGWGEGHGDVRDLSYLGYTAIDSLRAADIRPLTKLEKISLPFTLSAIDDGVFSQSPNLRYVDMLMCDSTMVVDDIKSRGIAALGIDSLRTLTYLPQDYGEAKGVNVVVADSAGLRAEAFRLIEGDYCVPYAFTADRVASERVLARREGQAESKYTVCLPYDILVPPGSKAYRLASRQGATLTFLQVDGRMDAFVPYLVVATDGAVNLGIDRKREIPSTTTASIETGQKQVNVPGYSMRGTMEGIDYKKAAELGAYILQASDNKWHLVKNAAGYENANIPAMRTCLLQRGGAGANSLSMELLDGIDDPDGVETIRTIDSDGTERYYDLGGRELPGRPERGIYIHNGKKHVSK